MRDGVDVTGLIHAARDGDEPALGNLLGLYRNYIRFLAHTGVDDRLRIKADGSDLAQDVLTRAYERFDQFRGDSEGELIAWLRTILANALAELARRYRVAQARTIDRERSIEEVLEQSTAMLAAALRTKEPSPRRAAEKRERSVLLADALAALSEDHRRVIMLRNIEQLSWNETGQRMNRDSNAARMLWTRALAKLGPILKERGLA